MLESKNLSHLQPPQVHPKYGNADALDYVVLLDLDYAESKRMVESENHSPLHPPQPHLEYGNVAGLDYVYVGMLHIDAAIK
nr:hypothetical protein [Tanacetum cinerariifolium]